MNETPSLCPFEVLEMYGYILGTRKFSNTAAGSGVTVSELDIFRVLGVKG